MPDTLFSKIIARQIPAKIQYEDDQYIVIHDIEPAAPTHLLVIPKRAIPTLNDVKPEDAPLIGGMFLVAQRVMRELGHTDYRTVFNCGPGAQQSVFHLHLHVLAGSRVHVAARMSQRWLGNRLPTHKKKTPPVTVGVFRRGENAPLRLLLYCLSYANPFLILVNFHMCDASEPSTHRPA